MSTTTQYYHEIDLILHTRGRRLPENIIHYVKGFTIAKSGYNSPAMLVIQIKEQYTIFADNIEDSDFITLTIDGGLEFEGLVIAVVERSSVTPDGAVENLSTIKVIDLAYLLQQFGQIILDPYMVNENKGSVFQEFIRAQIAILQKRFSGSLSLPQYCSEVMFETFSAYNRLIQRLGLGSELLLANGVPVLGKLLSAFGTVDTLLSSVYPLSVQALFSSVSVMQLWQDILPETYYDIIFDTYPSGYAIPNSHGGVVAAPGFGIVIRESAWLTFAQLPAKQIADSVIMAVDGTRGAQERKTMFMVIPMWDNMAESAIKGSGAYTIDGDVLKTWGLSQHTTRLNYVAKNSTGHPTQVDPLVLSKFESMANQVKDAYKDINKYYTGTITARYVQVKASDKIRFKRNVSFISDEVMEALVQGYTHTYQAGAQPRLNTEIDFIHGVRI